MKTLAAFLKNDIKLLLNDWKTLVIIFVMPVVLILYFSYAVYPAANNNKVIESFDLGLVDKENSIESRILSEQLAEIKLFNKVYKTSEPEARKLILQDRISAAIIIPDGFTQSITSGENKSITVLGNARRQDQSRIVKSLIQGASNLVSSGQGLLYTYYNFVKKAGVSEDELNREFNKLSQAVVMKALERKSVISGISTYPESNLTPSEYYTSALFALFLMFSGMPVLKMLVNERITGISKRVSSTNAGYAGTIFSKVILSFILASAQALTVIILTSTFIRNYWGAPRLTIAVLLAAGIFSVSCWSLFVAAISRTLRSAEIIGNLGILMMGILGGSIYPLAKMPAFLKPFSALTINRWLQEGFFRVFSGDRQPDISFQVFVLLIIGTAFLTLSMFIYRLRKVR